MLIPVNEVYKILNDYKIKVNGVLHIGAHECEEMYFYKTLHLNENDMIWIDALPNKCDELRNRKIPNVYNLVITDKDNEDITFNVANNWQSSSVLNLKTHKQEHPHIHYMGYYQMKTTTLNTFFKQNVKNPEKYNIWNIDIQGAELLALKGAGDYVNYADMLYLEVNEKELYENCGLIGEIDEYLQKYNFKRVYTQMEKYGWGDAIYVKIR
jgi:FkbM family methyltransferase